MPRAERARNWVFTINNPTEQDCTWCCEYGAQQNKFIASIEIGDNKTRHIQGEVAFKGLKTLEGLKKLHPRAHWEIKRSKDWGYPLKVDSELLINNVGVTQGKRNDIDDFNVDVESMISGKRSWHNMYMANLPIFAKYNSWAIRHISYLRKRSKLFEAKEFKQPLQTNLKERQSLVMVGPTGIGKTRYALAHFENPLLVRELDELRFYADNDGIVFDDINFTEVLTRTQQIHLLDEIKCTLHLRYNDVDLPDVPYIFTGNSFPFYFDDAINRRVELLTWDGPLF